MVSDLPSGMVVQCSLTNCYSFVLGSGFKNNSVLFPRTEFVIIESVDSICGDSVDTQLCMLIQTNFSKSPKQLTYKPL